MREIRVNIFISHSMEPFLNNAISDWRKQNDQDGFSFDNQEVIDLILEDALKEVLIKYGYDS